MKLKSHLFNDIIDKKYSILRMRRDHPINILPGNVS